MITSKDIKINYLLHYLQGAVTRLKDKELGEEILNIVLELETLTDPYSDKLSNFKMKRREVN